VYLGLGSNLGDRELSLERALAGVSELMSGLRIAPIYETEPLEGAGPQRFLNTVASGWTSLEATMLLDRLHGIEANLGRRREPGASRLPRTIDIDVLLFADRVQNDPRLCLPHPRMHERRFVLAPLLELAPAVADPRSGRPYRSWLAELPPQGVCRRHTRSR